MAHLPDDVQPFVRFLWLTGWGKREALGREWRSMDLVTGTIRIEDTKSGEPRTLPFHALPELDTLIRDLHDRTSALDKKRACLSEATDPNRKWGTSGDNRPPSWVPLPSQVVDGLVAWDGVEPPTRGFSVRCSTS